MAISRDYLSSEDAWYLHSGIDITGVADDYVVAWSESLHKFIVKPMAVSDGGGGAPTEHDHNEYLLKTGGAITGVVTVPSPVGASDIANRSYVDTAVNTIQHGSLPDLNEDHHPQYILVDGSRSFTVTPTVNGNIIWHAGNDGAGSGLDADRVDGQHASAFATAVHTHPGLSTDDHDHDAAYVNEGDHTKALHDAMSINAGTLGGINAGQFLRSDANDSATGALTFSNSVIFNYQNEGLEITGNSNYFGSNFDARVIRLIDQNGANGVVDGGLVFEAYTIPDSIAVELLVMRNSVFTWKGNDILHVGNHGSSGNPHSQYVQQTVADNRYLRADTNTTYAAGTLDLASGTVLDAGMGTLRVSTPTADNHAANKSYVDSVVQGLDFKQSVRAAETVTSLTLSGTQTVDGVALGDGDRVLVTVQSSQSSNGIWIVRSGAWERPADFDGNASVTEGAFVFVEDGGQFNNTGWVLGELAGTWGSYTEMTWSQFSGAGETVEAGDGLTKSGAVVNVGAGVGISVGIDTVSLDLTYTDGRYLQSDSSPEYIADIVGAMFFGNTETGIAVTYQDADNTIDLAVSYGTPVSLTPDLANSAGTGSTAARHNHVHNIPASTAVTISNTSINSEGTAASFARSDHMHAVQITEAGVTQHQAALSITESQITNLDHYTSTDFTTDFNLKSTSNLTEGTNLYYTTARANSAIDIRVTKAFVDALNVDADTLDGVDSTGFVRVTGAAMTGSLDLGSNRLSNAIIATSTQGQGHVLIPGFMHNELSNWTNRGGTFSVTPTNVTAGGSAELVHTPGKDGATTVTYTPDVPGANVVLEWTGLSLPVYSDGNGARVYIVTRAGNMPDAVKIEILNGSSVWTTLVDDLSPNWSSALYVTGYIPSSITIPHRGVRVTLTWNEAGAIWYLSEVGYVHRNSPFGVHAFPTINQNQTIYGTWSFNNVIDADISGDADTVDGNHASAFATAVHTHAAGDVTSGTFTDARISASSVQQHVTKTYVDSLAINANLLDGVDSASFLRSDAADTWTGKLTWGGGASTAISLGSNTAQLIDLYQTSYGIGIQSSTVYVRTSSRFSIHSGGVHDNAQNIPGTGGTNIFTVTAAEIKHNTNIIWTAGNDGAGSGLDADTVDGLQASAFATSGHNHDSSYVNSNSAITGATRTKITYDSKGLVTAGALLTASDIPNLDASKITTGALPVLRGGTGLNTLTNGYYLRGNGSATEMVSPVNVRIDINAAPVSHDHTTAQITSGTFDNARISAASVQQHVTKTYVDTLNVDADTLDGKHADDIIYVDPEPPASPIADQLWVDTDEEFTTGNASFTTVIGNGTNTTYTISHPLGTTALILEAYELSTGEQVFPTFEVEDPDTVQVRFSMPPPASSIKISFISLIPNSSPVGLPIANYAWQPNGGSTFVVSGGTESVPMVISDHTITNPGTDIELTFGFDGYFYTSSNDGVVLLEVAVSLDGGASFSVAEGSRTAADTNGTNIVFAPVSTHGLITGIPSGDIVIRLQAWLFSGAALTLHGTNNRVWAQLAFSEPVVLDNRYTKLDDTGWIETAPLNGWANYDAASYTPLRYRRKNGIVFIEGFLAIGGQTSTTICELPVGFRPALHSFNSNAVDSAYSNVRLDTLSGGAVRLLNYSGSATWVAFSHSFAID